MKAVGGRLPAPSVFVPVVNLVVMTELFWGPFSAKILSTYSVAGSRSVRAYSTVFPDTVRVISGTRHKIHTPRQLPLPVWAISTLGTWHTHLLLATIFSDPAERQVLISEMTHPPRSVYEECSSHIQRIYHTGTGFFRAPPKRKGTGGSGLSTWCWLGQLCSWGVGTS